MNTSGYLRSAPALTVNGAWGPFSQLGPLTYSRSPFRCTPTLTGGSFETVSTSSLDSIPDASDRPNNLVIGYKRQAKACCVCIGRPLVTRAPDITTASQDCSSTLYARAGIVGPTAPTLFGTGIISRCMSGGTYALDAHKTVTLLDPYGYVYVYPEWQPGGTLGRYFTGGNFQTRVVYASNIDPGFLFLGRTWHVFPKGMSIFWSLIYYRGTDSSILPPREQISASKLSQIHGPDDFVYLEVQAQDAVLGDSFSAGAYIQVRYISAEFAHVEVVNHGYFPSLGLPPCQFKINSVNPTPDLIAAQILLHPNTS